MKCPYLQGNDQLVCNAQKEHHVPSKGELREYCTTRDYEVCIIYCSEETEEPAH